MCFEYSNICQCICVVFTTISVVFLINKVKLVTDLGVPFFYVSISHNIIDFHHTHSAFGSVVGVVEGPGTVEYSGGRSPACTEIQRSHQDCDYTSGQIAFVKCVADSTSRIYFYLNNYVISY